MYKDIIIFNKYMASQVLKKTLTSHIFFYATKN